MSSNLNQACHSIYLKHSGVRGTVDPSIYTKLVAENTSNISIMIGSGGSTRESIMHKRLKDHGAGLVYPTVEFQNERNSK